MEHTYFHYLAAKDCKYTLNGMNLFEMRKAKLRVVVAKPLGLDMEGTKNEVLGRCILALDRLEAPNEITELAQMGAGAVQAEPVNERPVDPERDEPEPTSDEHIGV